LIQHVVRHVDQVCPIHSLASICICNNFQHFSFDRSRLFAATNRSSAPKQSQQQWGLTPPLSTAAPTPLEVRANECLVSLIRDHYKMFETAEGDAHRLEVLMQLDEVVQAWVRDECIKLGMGEHAISDNKPILRTFGSYRVGVHGAGTDIDLLCIAPNFVTRECFFAELLPRLRANSKVTELKGVPNAYVPVMQFKFDGVEFDLLYAPLPSAAIKNLNIFDDNILRNLDQETYLSLNGPRVTDMVLDLVPDQENYRITLRCVKLWAKSMFSCSLLPGNSS
jgi:poly(A) polymerase